MSVPPFVRTVELATVLSEAAGLFTPSEMPKDFDGTEYARGVTELTARLLGLTNDDLRPLWTAICTENRVQQQTGRKPR